MYNFASTKNLVGLFTKKIYHLVYRNLVLMPEEIAIVEETNT